MRSHLSSNAQVGPTCQMFIGVQFWQATLRIFWRWLKPDAQGLFDIGFTTSVFICDLNWLENIEHYPLPFFLPTGDLNWLIPFLIQLNITQRLVNMFLLLRIYLTVVFLLWVDYVIILWVLTQHEVLNVLGAIALLGFPPWSVYVSHYVNREAIPHSILVEWRQVRWLCIFIRHFINCV